MKMYQLGVLCGLGLALLIANPVSALAGVTVVLDDGKSVVVDGKIIKIVGGSASARRLGQDYIAGSLSAAKAAAGKSTYLSVHLETPYNSRNGKVHIKSQTE